MVVWLTGRQIGASGIPDKETIACQQEPGVLSTHPVARQQADTIGAVPRRVQHPQIVIAQRDLLPIVQAPMGKGDVCYLVQIDRRAGPLGQYRCT